MTIKEYQEKASRTVAELGSPLEDDLHMIMGMVTETAEIADIYKKHMAYKKDLNLDHVKEEVGDLMWYIANLCNQHGWNLEDIMDVNIEKLEVRYPEKFSEDKAVNRDLKSENKIIYGNV